MINKLKERKQNKIFSKTFLHKGFTLIELLVVIAIISLIVAISLFGIQNARKTSRDTKRRADLEQIRSALELYKADCGSYPATISQGDTIKGSGSTASCALSNTYIQIVPSDPLPSQKYSYTLDGSDSNKYYLCTSLENPANGNDITGCDTSCDNDTLTDPAVICNYKVINP